ncbi:MAG: hypothetical protein F6K42_28970, partial [Leptolyngbya sp. SIO1D8]|nr:hypothetical protein [Leptolyngbya sp. SIO1D8]
MFHFVWLLIKEISKQLISMKTRLKKSIRYSYAILLSMLVLYTGHAQNSITPQALPSSPDAASLGKYGKFPVNLSSGLVNVGIPLYELNTRKLSLSMSLSYHASGIKVADKAGSVGLGWSLNVGGVITRAVRGQPDEKFSSGFLNNTVPDASELTPDDWQFVEDIVWGDIDTQQDVFFYNFPGRSGKFTFDKQKNPITIPSEPLKITFDPDTIQIIDEQGIIYKFGAKETSQVVGDEPYVSSWYLSQIISADGSEKIDFFYGTSSAISNFAMMDMETIGGPDQQHTFPPQRTQYVTVQTLKLKEINFPNGKVLLDHSARTDWDSGEKLDKVRILRFDHNASSYTLLRSIDFIYDYFIS